jgi:RNA polymerase sigma-70 factor (ECF subfamily)
MRFRPPDAHGGGPTPAGRLAEHELTARCVAGDETAQRELFRRQKRRVASRLFPIVGPGEQLDDIIQEVFLAVFRNLHTFRGDSSLANWIDRIAVRTLFAHIRRRQGREQLERAHAIVAADWDSAERRVFAREATRRLCGALEALDPKQRAALLLHAFEGRSMRQIARQTGCTLVATKARIWRARRTLKEHAFGDSTLAEYVGGRTF